MSITVLVGAQWGDEGKGKVVDLITENDYSCVVRGCGGANAGHTIMVGDKKFVAHLLPSGVVHGKLCVLGSGMVIDPIALLQEIEMARSFGLDINPNNLIISNGATIVFPQHKELDANREASTTSIGTTKRGIGPAYETKASRFGVKMFMIKDPGHFVNSFLYLSRNIGIVYDCLATERTISDYLEAGKKLAPFIKNHVPLVEDILNKGLKVLVEGAQGALLDPDYGTYPFVTSSSTTAAGALAGAGIGVRGIDRVIGVVKAYTTRIGTGPFPTEQSNEKGTYLRERGKEYGATTGRPRRCGWLDIPALKYAGMLNGLTEIALTKIDILSDMEGIKVCTYYENGSSVCDAHDMYSLVPHYVEVPPFNFDGRVKSWEDLSEGAKGYISLVQEGVGVRVGMVSYGPKGSDTLVL